MFLILIDAHTKWIEVCKMKFITSSVTTERLRSVFATHGLPKLIVTDNATTFTSAELQEFLRLNGIMHKTSAPFHPQTNGLAERAVRTFKNAMKKMSEGSIDTKISRFLFSYHNTPQSTTGTSPAQLLFHRRPRSHLDLLHPDLNSHVQIKQSKQKEQYDSNKKLHQFKSGEKVFVRNFLQGPKWLPGIICSSGPTSYNVELSDHRVVRKHIDQIRIRYSDDNKVSEEEEKSYTIPSVIPESVILPSVEVNSK